MDHRYLNLLQAHDGDAIDPRGFDYAVAGREVEDTAVSLAALIGYMPTIDASVQDSTHFAEITLQKEFDREIRPVIRFSISGRFVKVLSIDRLDSLAREKVVAILKDHGYVYIPSEVLEEPYVGVDPDFRTWLERFFYYW